MRWWTSERGARNPTPRISYNRSSVRLEPRCIASAGGFDFLRRLHFPSSALTWDFHPVEPRTPLTHLRLRPPEVFHSLAGFCPGFRRLLTYCRLRAGLPLRFPASLCVPFDGCGQLPELWLCEMSLLLNRKIRIVEGSHHRTVESANGREVVRWTPLRGWQSLSELPTSLPIPHPASDCKHFSKPYRAGTVRCGYRRSRSLMGMEPSSLPRRISADHG